MNKDSASVAPFPALHLDNQLCFSLYSLSRLVIQSYTPLLKPLDLTYPQYLVMLVLWQGLEEESEGMAVKQLTQSLRLDTGTVTPLLKRMEAKGLLERKRSQQDERIVMVSLTVQGCQLRDKAKAIPQSLMCQSQIDSQQVIELRESLKAMMAVMGEELDE
jgi:MarR family transcriptional regulator, organic hydroperoxide resistance regulator